MIHPLGVCATAAVSVEEGVDKIRLGKAGLVVAGGFDELTVDGIIGFGDMAAPSALIALEHPQAFLASLDPHQRQPMNNVWPRASGRRFDDDAPEKQQEAQMLRGPPQKGVHAAVAPQGCASQYR